VQHPIHHYKREAERLERERDEANAHVEAIRRQQVDVKEAGRKQGLEEAAALCEKLDYNVSRKCAAEIRSRDAR